MPETIKLLVEEILAMNPRQRARFLSRLAEALDGLSSEASHVGYLAESESSYRVFAQRNPAEKTTYLYRDVPDDQSMEGGGRMQQFERITQAPGLMGGKACIRGMRVTVGMIVGQIGDGASIDEILADYPYLEREDVMQALLYAAWRTEEREVLPLH